MQMDTIPESLENLQLSFPRSQVTISPWLSRKNTFDLYVADEKGNFMRELSPGEKSEFESGIRDWLREMRGAKTKQVWPSTVDPQEFITISFKGDTTFKVGEIVSTRAFAEENERVKKLNLRPAEGWLKSKGVLRAPGNGDRPSGEIEGYRADNINLLAVTEGDPIRKFCCRQCGECAPGELLGEGKFPERISWLRHHYQDRHQGMWGHMSQTEEWLKSLTSEQEELLRETNKRISRLTTYGVRTEKIQKVPVRSLIWSNGSAAWYQGDTISDQYAAAFERFAQSPEYKRLPGDVVPTAPGYPKGAFCKAGETVRLDANEILVYGEEKDVRAILSELNPLPLYKYSTEAGMRGFGTQPPPESKHWAWPPIYEKDKQPTVEYLPDSAEFLAQTIIATGYREKLDKAFQEAIARGKYGSA